MKKNKLEEVNIMEGINFEKSRYQQRKNEKTRRIRQAEKKRKQELLTRALYISLAINCICALIMWF